MGEARNSENPDNHKIAPEWSNYKIGSEEVNYYQNKGTPLSPGEVRYVVNQKNNIIAQARRPFKFEDLSIDRPIGSSELAESAINKELKAVYQQAAKLLKSAGLEPKSYKAGVVYACDIPTPNGVLTLEFIPAGPREGQWLSEPAIKVAGKQNKKILGNWFKREEYEDLEISASGNGKYRRYRPKYSGKEAKDERDAKSLFLAEVKGSKNIQPNLLVTSAKDFLGRATAIVNSSIKSS